VIKSRLSSLAVLALVLLASSLAAVLAVGQATPTAYTITVSVNPTDVLWGSSVTVAGTITPSYDGPVVLVFSEGGKGLVATVNASAVGGVFTASWTPVDVGYWSVVAVVADSFSEPAQFTVRYSTPSPAPPQPSAVASVRGPPIGFSEDSSYVTLNFTMFIIKFQKSSGASTIYARNGSVVVYYHFMVLEYWNDKVKDWRQAGAFQSLQWVKHDDYHYTIVEYFQDASTTPRTNYTISYDVRSDSRVKIAVKIYNGGSARTYRIHWVFDGIVYNDWRERKNADNVKCGLVFGNETVVNKYLVIDWQDVYESFGDVASYSVATSAQGRKADIYFGLGSVAAGGVLTVDPSVVGTSTSATAVSNPYQRKGFYANGRFWVFYSDGTNMVYSTSLDGVVWTTPTIIKSSVMSGSDFSVWFDGIYLHYAYASGYIYYRRGTPNSDGTITWSAAEQTISTTFNGAAFPTISVDSNGYVWIGYMDCNDVSYCYPYVIRSGNNDGTWGTTPSGFPYQLSTVGMLDWRVSVVSLTSGKVFVLYGINGEPLYARVWSGSAWGSEVNTTSSISINRYHSAVAQGDIVHVVFLKYSTNDIIYVNYTYSTNSFGSERILQAGASSYSAPVISADPVSGDLYVFAATKTTGTPSGWVANHIYYIKYSASSRSWGSWVDWVDESASTLYQADALTAFYQAYSRYVGVLYLTGAASPYSVKFAFIKHNAPPAIGGFQAPAKAFPGMWFYVNATVNDPDGVNDFVNATVGLSGEIVLRWVNSTNSFSVYADPNKYVIALDTSKCVRTQINSTAYRLSWRVMLDWGYPEGYVSVDSASTKVFDAAGAYGSGGASNLLYVEDDVVVGGAAPTAARVNPGATVRVRGTLNYEGTATPVNSTGAMYFDGVDDYISVTDSPSLDLTSAVTIEAQVMSFKQDGQAIVLKNYVGHRSYWLFLYASNRGYPSFEIASTSNYYSVIYWTVYPVFQTHQLVGTFDGRYLKIYYDASLKGMADIGTTVQMRVYNEPLFIARADSSYSKLAISLIRIYSYALSDSEILWNYNYPDNPVRSGLVLWLQADPAYVKDIDGDGRLEWLDLSGYNNHGKIYGAVLAGVFPSVEFGGSVVSTNSYIFSNGTYVTSFTAPNSVGSYTYKVFTRAYGLSTSAYKLSVANKTFTLIVDGIRLSDYVVDLRNDKVYVRAVYAYDGQPIPSATVRYGDLTATTNATGWAVFDLSGVSDVFYSLAYGVSEPAYGLTYPAQNATPTFGKKVVGPFTVKATSAIVNPVWDDVRRVLEFNASGTAVVRVGDYGMPKKIEVDGQVWTDWAYDMGRQEVTINNLHSHVVIYWGGGEASDGGGGGGGGVYVPPQPSVPLGIPPAPSIPSGGLVGLGLLAIVGVILGSFIYSQVRPKPISRKWSERLREAKKTVRWRRKSRFE
jgi:hypothetical protein